MTLSTTRSGSIPESINSADDTTTQSSDDVELGM